MARIRLDGRSASETRPISIEVGVQRYAEGSAQIDVGNTRVICSASVSDALPAWRRDSRLGWVTAEYGMLPRATHTRSSREAREGRQGGRTLEIQRLVGRSLRAVTDPTLLGERTVTLDCDVIQADGGTRTAAITGAYVALFQATNNLVREGKLEKSPLREAVAAISLGYVDGDLMLDLAYDEDSQAQSDFNVVATASGRLVELQGTAEAAPFERAQLNQILDLAYQGIESMLTAQGKAIKAIHHAALKRNN